MISGRYQQRDFVEQPLPAGTGVPGEMTERGLEASPFSLPRFLKTCDYATALMGKWHLGYAPSQSPLAHGFDTFFGLKSGYHDYWQHTDSRGEPDLWENDTRVRVSGYSTDLITRRAVEIIAAHAREPFFLDVAFNAPHWPFQDPETASVAVGNARFLKRADSVTATRAHYVRMVERLDQRIGDILAALERHGLTRHTLVIFTNDNGGEWLSDNSPLFNRKWTTWEGGIRGPALVRCPGRIPAGRVTSQVGITMDLTASILAAAGLVVPAEARLEGMDLLPVLTGQAPPAERTLFWRSTMRGGTQRAARRGDLKIVSDATHTFLFDVRRDPGERRDLARRQPHDVRALSLLLAAWEQSVDAEAARRRKPDAAASSASASAAASWPRISAPW